ncbi:MAG: hypothetical protein H6581_22575 [Bacteroidia bacterium]|nr:hypothetical protein [Bacteroidia bacterium]
MSTLTQMQVNLIRGDLRREGIEMTDLEDDLLDHICCALEEEMGNFSSFEQAYDQIKQEFCPNGYREIQTETTHLLTIKFNKMKKILNAIGIAGAAMVVFGTAFKFAHWPTATELLVLGTTTLALAYLPLMMILSLKTTDRPIGKVRNAIGYLAGSGAMIGFLFKVMHWPGANVVAMGSIVAFCVLFLPLFVATSGKEAILKVSPVASSILVLVSACGLFFMLAPKASARYTQSMGNLTDSVEETFEVNHDRLIAHRTIFQTLDTTQSGSSQALSGQAEELISYIEDLKTDILRQLDLDPRATGNRLPSDQALQFATSVTNPIFSEGSASWPHNGQDLKTKLAAFQSQLGSDAGSRRPTILDTSAQTAAEGAWLDRYFIDQPLFVIFNNLTLIQLEITNLEWERMVVRS